MKRYLFILSIVITFSALSNATSFDGIYQAVPGTNDNNGACNENNCPPQGLPPSSCPEQFTIKQLADHVEISYELLGQSQYANLGHCHRVADVKLGIGITEESHTACVKTDTQNELTTVIKEHAAFWIADGRSTNTFTITKGQQAGTFDVRHDEGAYGDPIKPCKYVKAPAEIPAN